jgi:hypothetical protein
MVTEEKPEKAAEDTTPEKTPEKEDTEEEIKEVKEVEPTKEEPKNGKETSAKQGPPPNEFGQPAMLLLVAGLAALYAIGSQPHIQAGNPMALFEPHVVAPPHAGKNDVVIQFCQS